MPKVVRVLDCLGREFPNKLSQHESDSRLRNNHAVVYSENPYTIQMIDRLRGPNGEWIKVDEHTIFPKVEGVPPSGPSAEDDLPFQFSGKEVKWILSPRPIAYGPEPEPEPTKGIGFFNKASSIRNWPLSILKKCLAEARSLLSNAETVIGNNGYIKLYATRNKELFAKLRELGFFDLHTSNQGWVVGLHQVVLYLRNANGGWRHQIAGRQFVRGEMEVHHVDGDPGNNDETNLEYVTPEENKALAVAARGNYFGTATTIPLEILQHCSQFTKLCARTIKAHAARLIGNLTPA